MLGPTTNLWAALLTIIALSIFMNWLQYHYVSRHVSDGNAKNDELFLNKSFSRRPESMQRTELGAFLRSRRGVIDVHSRLPETRDHFAKLSVSSEIDADDLGKYLANKSARVYNPGTTKCIILCLLNSQRSGQISHVILSFQIDGKQLDRILGRCRDCH